MWGPSGGGTMGMGALVARPVVLAWRWMKVPEPPSKTVFLRIMVPGTPVQRAPALAADGFQSVFGATQVTRQRRWGPALGVTGGAEWAPPAYGIRLRGAQA